ncbi:hypothetical protein 20Sep420_00067 [Pseudomonas phage 20Sep420]|nr:hypothetical protein 20Sep420_00067 [Pseudomonas phage 20Sep420]
MKKPNTKNQAIRRSWAYRNRNIDPCVMKAAWRDLPKGVVVIIRINAKYHDRLKTLYFGDGSSLHFAYNEDNYVRTVKTGFNGNPVEQRLHHTNMGHETKWFIPLAESKNEPAPAWELRTGNGKIVGMIATEVKNRAENNRLSTQAEIIRQLREKNDELENVLRTQKAITKACEKIANDRGHVIKRLTRALIEQTDSGIKLKAALHAITAEANLMGLLSCLRPPNSTVTTGDAVKRLITEGDIHHGRAKALFEAAKAESETNGCEAIKAAQQEVRSERTNGARAPWDR